MNWKLILQLSLFGLVMGIGTVFFIPSTIEPLCWLAIFIISAFLIAKDRRDNHFLHGLFLGIANSVWITAAHVLLFNQYAANHVKEMAMMSSMPLSPRLMMLLTGPIVGVVSGIVIGLFAWLAGKLVKPAPRALTTV